jgi:putative transcriptional regulator
MSITRHLDDATLLSFAAGSLPPALAVVAAAHVAFCPRCRDEVGMMELVGGALLGSLPGAAMLGGVPAPPQVEPAIAHHRTAASHASGAGEIPPPLARLVGSDLDAVRWRWISRGVWLRRVPIGGEGQLHLFKGSPGVALPEHGHHGSELTMVLRGTLDDSTGHYGPGDVCDLDDSVEHIPVAGAEGCICVVAQDKPVRWRSLIVRLARPWHGM